MARKAACFGQMEMGMRFSGHLMRIINIYPPKCIISGHLAGVRRVIFIILAAQFGDYYGIIRLRRVSGNWMPMMIMSVIAWSRLLIELQPAIGVMRIIPLFASCGIEFLAVASLFTRSMSIIFTQ